MIFVPPHAVVQRRRRHVSWWLLKGSHKQVSDAIAGRTERPVLVSRIHIKVAVNPFLPMVHIRCTRCTWPPSSLCMDWITQAPASYIIANYWRWTGWWMMTILLLVFVSIQHDRHHQSWGASPKKKKGRLKNATRKERVNTVDTLQYAMISFTRNTSYANSPRPTRETAVVQRWPRPRDHNHIMSRKSFFCGLLSFGRT